MASAIRRAIEEERELVAVTVISAPQDGAGARVDPGARLLVEPSGASEGSLGDSSLDASARAAATKALADGQSVAVALEDGVEAFVEVLQPPIRLLVCGAGHDAIPLVRFAASLGWRVEVADDRPAFLNSGRFPEAGAFVHTDPAEVASTAAVDGRTYAVVMTHNFLRDKDYLGSLLGSPVPYIGMLGPRARFEQLLEQLRREGIDPLPEHVPAVHSPAGLDLGAEGPEEIAWAVVAEILATKNRRGAGFLRDRSGPIHDQPHAAEIRGEPEGRPTPAASEVPARA
jgi:xanthine dehydrogenase accessory factor